MQTLHNFGENNDNQPLGFKEMSQRASLRKLRVWFLPSQDILLMLRNNKNTRQRVRCGEERVGWLYDGLRCCEAAVALLGWNGATDRIVWYF